MSRPTPSRRANTWTDDQRIVLRQLHTDFDNIDEDTRAKIFNFIFDDHLKACGIRGGLSAGILGSQYRDRTRAGRSHLWRSAIRPPVTDAGRARREQLTARIYDAASALGISLNHRGLNSEGVADDRIDRDSQDATEHDGQDDYTVDPTQETQRKAGIPKRNKIAVNDIPSHQTGLRGPGVTSQFNSDLSISAVAGGPNISAGHHNANLDDEAGSETAAMNAEIDDESDEDESDEDESEPEGLVESSDDDEAACTQGQFATKIPLDMLHRSHIDWREGLQPRVNSLESSTVIHTSSTYHLGGQVHRITTPNGQEADFMLCDTVLCTTCTATSAETNLTKQGLPFIHSSDTTRDNKGITVFTPQPRSKYHESRAIEQCSYRRYVRFQSHNHGAIFCWARICGYAGCEVCVGEELQRKRKRDVGDDGNGEDAGVEEQQGKRVRWIDDVD